MHKFEKLEVWHLAVAYVDTCYAIAEQLPKHERYNLASQLQRAAVSITLNIAEGSTSQTDPEQARFLRMAIRSLIETVACQHLIHRRGYLRDAEPLRVAYQESERLVAKLQALRRALGDTSVREAPAAYDLQSETPFDTEGGASTIMDSAACLSAITDRLASLDPAKVILFGSRADDTATEASDVDLIVVLKSDVLPRTYREKEAIYLEVARRLRDIRRNTAMDLIVHTQPMHDKFIEMNSLFAREVLQKGVVLYESHHP
jgi:four helix bundle protein